MAVTTFDAGSVEPPQPTDTDILNWLERQCSVTLDGRTSGVIELMDGEPLSWFAIEGEKREGLREAVAARMREEDNNR